MFKDKETIYLGIFIIGWMLAIIGINNGEQIKLACLLPAGFILWMAIKLQIIHSIKASEPNIKPSVRDGMVGGPLNNGE